MSKHRELSFDEDKPVNYVQEVLQHVSNGQFTVARLALRMVPDKEQAARVRRAVAFRTGIYL